MLLSLTNDIGSRLTNATGNGSILTFMDVGVVQWDYDSEELALELPSTLLVPLAVVLACLLMVGVVGNILVISIILRARFKERTRSLSTTASTTNAYILSLSAADLLFLIFCAPFQGTVYILNHWPYGWFMCKVAHYCQFCTAYASVWILTMMSVDRYVAIGHPLKSVKWRRPRQATRISIGVWVSAALLSLPWLVLYEADEHETGDGQVRIACYDAWSDSTYQYRKWMILFVFLIDFMIPSFIIFCMAVLVAKSIRTSTRQPLFNVTSACDSNHVINGSMQECNGHMPKLSNGVRRSLGAAVGTRLRRRRRVGWLVFGLAILFFICWTPHNLSVIWLNFAPDALDWIHTNYQAFFVVKVLAHMMTYMNSCINPVFYSLASHHFRSRCSYACRGRSSRPGASVTTLNSSFRCDHRTVVQTGQSVVWRRQPSTCNRRQASVTSNRLTSAMAQKPSFPCPSHNVGNNLSLISQHGQNTSIDSITSGLAVKSSISETSNNLLISVHGRHTLTHFTTGD